MKPLSEILSEIVFVFDNAYPGLNSGIPAEFRSFIYLPRDEALRILLKNRENLDRLIHHLFLHSQDKDRCRTVSHLDLEQRFCLLDRFWFAFGMCRSAIAHNSREGRTPTYAHPDLLIDLCTERYRLNVIAPCLSSSKPPFYLWQGPLI